MKSPLKVLEENFTIAKVICKINLEPWIIDHIQAVDQLSKLYVWNKHKQKKEHMHIGGEEEENILSCVDFTRTCNLIRRFPSLSIDIFTNGINFPLSSCARAFKWRENFLTGLNKYVKQINKSRYFEYISTDHFYINTFHFKEQVICD